MTPASSLPHHLKYRASGKAHKRAKRHARYSTIPGWVGGTAKRVTRWDATSALR